MIVLNVIVVIVKFIF